MDLYEKINNFKGSQIIGLDTKVTVKLKGGKSNPYQGKVTKITEGQVCMIFNNGLGYKNMVNRRLKKQLDDDLVNILDTISRDTDFVPGDRKWGVRIKGTPLVEHKGEHYLEVIFLKKGKTQYYLNGSPIDVSEISDMLPDKKEGDQGGLEDKVILRTFSLKSILKIRKGGEEIDVQSALK